MSTPISRPGTGPRSVLPVPVPRVPEQEEQENTGLYTNIGQLMDNGIPEPPTPGVMRRSDGVGLFYEGYVNWLFGDPESGKSLLSTAATVEAVTHGRRALWIDMDHNGPQATVNRLLGFGAPADMLRSAARFRYVEPEDETHLARVIGDSKRWCPQLAVVDSIGELLPLLGLGSNSPDDFTTANQRVLKPLAMVGACVIANDHLAKNADSRAAGSTGTAAKKRAVSGVSIRVTVAEQFTPGAGGSAHLTINKDRHGGLRANSPRPDSGEPYAGTFRLDDDGAWSVSVPESGAPMTPTRAAAAERSSRDAAKIAQWATDETRVRDVKDRMGWGSERASDALDSYRNAVLPVPEHGVREQEEQEEQENAA